MPRACLTNHRGRRHRLQLGVLSRRETFMSIIKYFKFSHFSERPDLINSPLWSIFSALTLKLFCNFWWTSSSSHKHVNDSLSIPFHQLFILYFCKFYYGTFCESNFSSQKCSATHRLVRHVFLQLLLSYWS